MTEIRIIEKSTLKGMERFLNETDGTPVGDLIIAGNAAAGFRFFHKVEFSMFEGGTG